jgi:hypothetical protein
MKGSDELARAGCNFITNGYDRRCARGTIDVVG